MIFSILEKIEPMCPSLPTPIRASLGFAINYFFFIKSILLKSLLFFWPKIKKIFF